VTLVPRLCTSLVVKMHDAARPKSAAVKSSEVKVAPLMTRSECPGVGNLNSCKKAGMCLTESLW
jgi:hypothetical protein